MDRKSFLASMLASLFVPLQKAKKKPSGRTNAFAGSCDTCTFYTATNTTSGTCNRYPKYFTVSGINAWQFPTMQANDVCGEYNKGA